MGKERQVESYFRLKWCYEHLNILFLLCFLRVFFFHVGCFGLLFKNIVHAAEI